MTKNNLRGYLTRNYANIQLESIYSLPAYFCNIPLSQEDAMKFSQTQLSNGRYVIFSCSPEMASSLIKGIQEGDMPQKKGRPASKVIPTTFAAFEAYCRRNNINVLHRTYMSDKSIRECLLQEVPGHSCDVKRTWYMYEVESLDIDNCVLPYIVSENNTIVVLAKASSSNYVSKRKKLKEKWQTMTPLYEQLIAALVLDKDDEVETLVGMYASNYYEKQCQIKSVPQLKEAYKNGVLTIFLGNRANFSFQTDEDWNLD